MTQIALAQHHRSNPKTNMDTAAESLHSQIVGNAVMLAALGLEVLNWQDIDNATFDACARIVRETGSIGNLNKSHVADKLADKLKNTGKSIDEDGESIRIQNNTHLRRGYNPPADYAILDTVSGLVDLLNSRVFLYNVPALADYRERMIRCAMDIGALVCARLRANGERPPDWAVYRFKAGR